MTSAPWRAGAVLGLYLAACAACSGGGSGAPPTPTEPSGDTVNLTGTWRGTADDSTGPGELTWQVTQSGASFSGTLTARDTFTGVTGRGAVTGTLDGTALQFSMTIAAGGFDAPFDGCTTTASGQGTATASTVSATYSGTNSCSGAIASGQLALTKQ